jgi:predicted dehydrogenase
MIRLAVIGTGGMAATHAQSFARMKGVALSACCDVDEKKARAFAHTWNIPRWYVDYDDMLGSEKLDEIGRAHV